MVPPLVESRDAGELEHGKLPYQIVRYKYVHQETFSKF